VKHIPGQNGEQNPPLLFLLGFSLFWATSWPVPGKPMDRFSKPLHKGSDTNSNRQYLMSLLMSFLMDCANARDIITMYLVMITTLVLICHMISLDLVSSSSLQDPGCFISIGMSDVIGLNWVHGNPTIFIRLSPVYKKHSVWPYSTVSDMCCDLWRSVLFLPVFCCLWHHDYSCPFCENIKYYSCHCSMGVLFLFWVECLVYLNHVGACVCPNFAVHLFQNYSGEKNTAVMKGWNFPRAWDWWLVCGLMMIPG
jgi:hypothetical protein